MKKVILSLICLSTTALFAQKLQKPNFHVGLATALPTDMNEKDAHLNLGSTWFQLSSKYNKKFTGTVDFGYLRFKGDSETNFAVVPFMVGLKYHVNDYVYFGSGAGVGFYNDDAYGNTSFMFSPYIGVVMGHITVDARYISVVEKNQPIKTIGLVFSYTL